MKILVIDIAAKSGGAQSIIEDFYENIKNDNKNEYYFLLSHKFIKEKKNIKVILVNEMNWPKRLFFDYFGAKKYIKEINPNAIISFQNTMPKVNKIHKVLYVHQSLPFQKIKKFSLFKKSESSLAIRQLFQGFFIKKSINRSDHVIVQTEWMKNAIVNRCKINISQIEVIQPQFDLDFAKKSQATDMYFNTFFYPTYDALYKNNAIIYEACNILDDKENNKYRVEMTMNKVDNISSNIEYIGRISRDKVFKKYSESVLIFPSYVESFGLPLLEARLCETIILASDTEFSREILNGYENAYFFNPFNATELAELMEKCINKKIIRKKCMNNFNFNSNSKKIIDIVVNKN